MRKNTLHFATIVLYTFLVMILLCAIAGVSTAPVFAFAASKTTMTRQGDTVWFGYYPQTKATDEEVAKMSSSPDTDGFFTSGKDKFVKVTNAEPQHAYHSGDNDYLLFDDGSLPVEGAMYYFKMEPIEWKVMVDDADDNAVKLVSKKFIDTHVWLSQFEKSVTRDSWAAYDNTLPGVPAETPANGWRYSEMRAWLNDGFLNVAFTEDEQKSIFVFANKNTIDYRSDDETTIVNDYVAIGNESDYDAAGNDGRPTDYAIVKGVRWQYNKDNCAYFVNAYATGGFPEEDIRGYISGDHNQVLTISAAHAVRPIVYVKRGDAKILATETQKEEKQSNSLLIFGIIAAILGAGMAIPFMAITSARYKKLPPEQKNGKFPYKKHEVPLIACGLVLLIGGLCMVFIPMAINNGGFGGLGGAKLQPGVYVQQGQYSGGGIAQVGHTAYRLNADGTFDYTDSYEHNPIIWSGHGTWSQSGSTVTFVWNGNPMVAAGYTFTANVYDNGASFGNNTERFKRTN